MSRSHHEGDGSMSSLSAGLSAYNAAEPKPMNSANNSVRSSRGSRAPPPPPQRPGSVAGGQSVASALSQGTAGRNRRIEEDERSSNTERLMGVVNELTGQGEYYDDHDQQSGSRNSRSRDPDERSQRSGRSSRKSGSNAGSRSRYDPEGMSHEYGRDDPDGRQYAPGSQYLDGNQPASSRGSVGGSRQSRSTRPSQYSGGGRDEGSYRSDQQGSYYDEQEPSVRQEEGSYYSRGSRAGGSRGSASRSVPAPPPRLSAEGGSQYSGQDEMSYAMSRGSAMSRESGAESSYKSSKKARPVPVKETDPNKRAMWWYNFSRCITCCFPDACIKKDDAEAKQAWREKVAICFCVFMASTFFVGIFGFIPVLLCRERTVYTIENIQARTNEEWIALHGNVYDVGGLYERHPTGPAGIEAFLHDDASRMFPRTPPAMLPDMCLNKAKFEDNEELQVSWGSSLYGWLASLLISTRRSDLSLCLYRLTFT